MHNLDPQLVFILAAVAVLALIVIAATLWLRRRRRNVWRRFAHRMNLHYRENNGNPLVLGALDGHAVELVVEPSGSDTGPMGVEQVTLAVVLHGKVPAELQVMPGGEVIGEIQRTLDDEVEKLGDEEFDRRLVAACPNHAAALVYLNQQRREALCRLVEEFPLWEPGIEERKVHLRTREMLSEPDELSRAARLLLETAKTMSQPDAEAGRSDAQHNAVRP